MWNVASFAAGRVILLATTVVTARLLSPEEFGLLGLALTITMFLDLLNDFGLTTAYVYFARDRDADEVADTAFGINIAIGVALTVATVVAAPFVAEFYGEPKVADILVALSVTYILMSAGAIQDGRMQARLDFRRRFYAEFSRAASKGAVTIGLAFAGFGVWSLVLGQIIGVAASSACFIVLERWRPRLRFDRRLAVNMLRYGLQLLTLGFVGLAAANIDFIFIGRRLGPEALGFYTLAFRLPSLAIRGTSSVVSQVAFSAYAKVSRDHAALSRALLVTLRMMAMYTVPVALGMAVLAPEAVEVLFGGKWEATGQLLRILALHSLLTVVVYSAGDVYKAVGRPGLLTLHALVKLAVAVPLLWVAAGQDLEAVAWAQVVVGAVSAAVQLVLLRSVLGIGPMVVARSLMTPVVAGAAMAATAYGVTQLLDDQTDLTRLVIGFTVGVVAYAATAWLVDPTGTRQTVGLLLPGRSTKEAV